MAWRLGRSPFQQLCPPRALQGQQQRQIIAAANTIGSRRSYNGDCIRNVRNTSTCGMVMSQRAYSMLRKQAAAATTLPSGQALSRSWRVDGALARDTRLTGATLLLRRSMGSADREPVGRTSAGLVGAGGLDSVWPFVSRSAILFLFVTLFATGCSYISQRKMRERGVWYKLAKLHYQIGQKGYAANALFKEALIQTRTLAQRSAYGDYDAVEELIKLMDLTVTCLLEALNHQDAKRLLDKWKMALVDIMQLDEADRLRVILSARYGDVYSCADDTMRAYQHYGQALRNGQLLVERAPTEENEALLGSIFEKSGRMELHNRNFEAACIFFEQALLQAAKVLPEHDKQVVGLLNSLATSYDNCARLDEGIAVAHQGLALAADTETSIHPLEVSALHFNLAALHLHKGDIAESRREVSIAKETARKLQDDPQLQACAALLQEITAKEREQTRAAEEAKKNNAWW
eukprot:scpid75082/ scgid25843/ 